MSTNSGDEDESGDQQRRKAENPGVRCTRANARSADLVRPDPQGACGRVPTAQLRERRPRGREEARMPRYAAVPEDEGRRRGVHHHLVLVLDGGNGSHARRWRRRAPSVTSGEGPRLPAGASRVRRGEGTPRQRLADERIALTVVAKLTGRGVSLVVVSQDDGRTDGLTASLSCVPALGHFAL